MDKYTYDCGFYRNKSVYLCTTEILSILNSIPEKDAEIASLLSRLTDVKTDRDASHKKCDALDDNNDRLQTEIEKLDAEIVRLRAKLAEDRAAKEAEKYERIRTRCPSCGLDPLFIGTGGHLTCSSLECKNPSVAREIERLRAAVNPKAVEFLIEESVYRDIEGYRVSLNGKTVNWSTTEAEAESYVASHQPRPVIRWVSRDDFTSQVKIWEQKPHCSESETKGKSFGGGVLLSWSFEPETVGVPIVPEGECWCFEVVADVWTRVVDLIG